SIVVVHEDNYSLRKERKRTNQNCWETNSSFQLVLFFFLPPHALMSVLHLQPQVFGLLVWTLIGGTEYLHIPALGWVMFVSVFYWVLTVILFLIYLTMAHTRIPQIPWTILGICFNGSASVLYLTAAVICAISLNVAIRERYYFISWVASTIFASLAMVSYAENTVVNFKSWRSKSEET
uniref:CKLF-like MARVEL transmembrane domain containing 8b n=1 Tax=Sinocyclocheilus grahami TaxID=75366 RepID=A0A672NID9_SINGR